jgi:hypothetical protein
MTNPINAIKPSNQDGPDRWADFNALRDAVNAGTKTLPDTAPQVPRTDGALRELWRRHQDNRKQITAAFERRDADDASQRDDELQDRCDSVCDVECKIERKIITARAEGALGLWVKLMAGVTWADTVYGDFSDQILADAAVQAEHLLCNGASADHGPDPVATLGRELAAVHRRLAQLSNADPKQVNEELEHLHDRGVRTLYARLDALEGLIASTPATTLEGAIAQMSVLGSDVNNTFFFEQDVAGQDERERRSRRLLFSILRVLEQATGASYEDIGGSDCFDPRFDPFISIGEIAEMPADQADEAAS